MTNAIKVDLDIDEFGDQVAKRVSAYLIRLFPQEPAEFWAALCDQAYQERQRLAAMADLVCMGEQECPFKQDMVDCVRFRALRPGQRYRRQPAFRWGAEGGNSASSTAPPEPGKDGQGDDAAADDPIMRAFHEGRLKPRGSADQADEDQPV